MKTADYTNKLRSDLPGLPDRIKQLPVGPNGYPVPWFVPWIDGVPEFRVADPLKRKMAIREKLCWVCGQKLGRYLAFVIGPMCAVNRISAEPPAHRECAEFSLKACPFLLKPQMVRRENDRPEETECPGFMIADNPGVYILWLTRSFNLEYFPEGVLFRLSNPIEWVAYREGRIAKHEELATIFEQRLPLLGNLAEAESPAAVAEFQRSVERARKLFGITP